jgi:PAS domain-containing protein
MTTNSQQLMDDKHHKELVSGLYAQMRQILDASQQPTFIYLDDNHKACNQQFANFLGYQSPEEWAQVPGFIEVYVAANSRNTLMDAYWNAVNNKNASTINLIWIRKNSTTVNSTMILVPISYEGHILSVHFITSTQ